MRTQKISFPNEQVLSAFPDDISKLPQAILELGLSNNQPVIVLIGGEIEPQHADVTHRAIQTISRAAEEMKAVIICGGTDMGVMAEIGQMRMKNDYKFPLVGIAPELLVTWPDGPPSTKRLWWGKERWPLAEHYSQFILVPGNQFGDESPWIVEAASMMSKGRRSVTILINGGEVSRKDIELSLANGRAVIVLSRTGRLADELSNRADRNELLKIVPAVIEQRVIDEIKAALTGGESDTALDPKTEKLNSFN